MPFDSGPYLLAAFLCEKVLVEADGVKSAIRIVDRVTHTVADPSPPETMQPFDYELALLLKFKSGSARGPMRLEIRLIKPSGESHAPLRQTTNFEGEDDRGVDIVGPMRLTLDQAGLYWFDVLLEEERVTKIPLRVIYLPQVIQTSGSPEDPSPN